MVCGCAGEGSKNDYNTLLQKNTTAAQHAQHNAVDEEMR